VRLIHPGPGERNYHVYVFYQILKSTTSAQRREIVQKPLTLESATKAAEALIKAAFRAAFDFIVQYVNESMIDESASGTASIGLLDMFGFETYEVKSFEQLCINYTIETLQ
jgi:myosin-5